MISFGMWLQTLVNDSLQWLFIILKSFHLSDSFGFSKVSSFANRAWETERTEGSLCFIFLFVYGPLIQSQTSHVCSCAWSLKCLTLCDPMDCSPPGSSVHRDSPGRNAGVGCHSLLQSLCSLKLLIKLEQIFIISTFLGGRFWRSRIILCHKRRKLLSVLPIRGIAITTDTYLGICREI